ncbi:hypothetical protein [Wolinella succinogenes]|uniref:hypothetical protein n=1 Tax=Wolinella succinogenes TaxID=844 RepID=UPI0013EAF01A|nr:hypothetical protein [Wolinella succinogenes]
MPHKGGRESLASPLGIKRVLEIPVDFGGKKRGGLFFVGDEGLGGRMKEKDFALYLLFGLFKEGLSGGVKARW